MYEEFISLFLAFRKAEGLAPKTINDYKYHLSRIVKGANDPRAAIMSYLGEATNPNTYNIRFKYIKKFFDWCISEGFVEPPHPLQGLKKRRPVGRVIHIENDILSSLLTLPDQKTFTGLRDYALMLLSMDCGTRPGESLQLKERDFNLPALIVAIPASAAKTRLPRTIPITAQTATAIQVLLRAHHPLWREPTVFCSQEGKPFAVNSWGQRLRKYSTQIGIKISPYHLRHAAALGMLRAGMSVFALRDMLGHADLSMTQKYLALTLDDLRREHRENNLIDSIAPKRHRIRKL